MAILQPPRSRFMIADILTESAAAAAAVNAVNASMFDRHASAYFQNRQHLLSASPHDDGVNDDNDESDSESCEPVDSDGKCVTFDTFYFGFLGFTFGIIVFRDKGSSGI